MSPIYSSRSFHSSPHSPVMNIPRDNDWTDDLPSRTENRRLDEDHLSFQLMVTYASHLPEDRHGMYVARESLGKWQHTDRIHSCSMRSLVERGSRRGSHWRTATCLSSDRRHQSADSSNGKQRKIDARRRAKNYLGHEGFDQRAIVKPEDIDRFEAREK